MIRFVEKMSLPRACDTTLTLPWEQRIKSRLRVVLDNGLEAGLFLERGIILRAGDVLRSENGVTVRVRAAIEVLSTVISEDPLLMAKVCYHLGNRHAVIQISKDKVQYLHDHVLDDMVRALGLDVVTEKASFEPESGAYATGGHHHG